MIILITQNATLPLIPSLYTEFTRNTMACWTPRPSLVLSSLFDRFAFITMLSSSLHTSFIVLVSSFLRWSTVPHSTGEVTLEPRPKLPRALARTLQHIGFSLSQPSMDGGLWLACYDALNFISFSLSLSLSPALFLIFVGFVELGASQRAVPPAGWTRRTP